MQQKTEREVKLTTFMEEKWDMNVSNTKSYVYANYYIITLK